MILLDGGHGLSFIFYAPSSSKKLSFLVQFLGSTSVPLSEAGEGHRLLKAGLVSGKVVLQV
jgi:hypothetical protein